MYCRLSGLRESLCCALRFQSVNDQVPRRLDSLRYMARYLFEFLMVNQRLRATDADWPTVYSFYLFLHRTELRLTPAVL